MSDQLESRDRQDVIMLDFLEPPIRMPHPVTSSSYADMGYTFRAGRRTALATSNFCGPRYRGMWRDIDWHRRLTGPIKSAPRDPELRR